MGLSPFVSWTKKKTGHETHFFPSLSFFSSSLSIFLLAVSMVEPTHVLVGYPIDFCHANDDNHPSSYQYDSSDPTLFLKSLGYANDAITCSFMAIMTDPSIHFFHHNPAMSSSRQMMHEMEACAAGIMHYAFDYQHEAETCVQQYLEQQTLLAAPLST